MVFPPALKPPHPAFKNEIRDFSVWPDEIQLYLLEGSLILGHVPGLQGVYELPSQNFMQVCVCSESSLVTH